MVVIVFRILFTVIIGIICAAASPKIDDVIASSCSTTQPLNYSSGVFTTEVILKGEDHKPHTFKFLVDTGYSQTSLTPTACSAIGCKTVRKQVLNDITNLTIEKTTPVTLVIGDKEFAMPELSLDDTSTLQMLKVDGVIGGDLIFKKDLIINLKLHYLCFPKDPIRELAEKLKFKKVSAMYDKGRVWTNFYANGQVIYDYFLDTGSDITSLLPSDIRKLKLTKIGMQTRNASEHGLHTVENYGPVTIKFGEVVTKLDSIAASSDSQMRKLGTDVLSNYVLGFDSESRYIFVGE